MASDLEANLIMGGLTPAAAKVIANAISNSATGRTSTGRQLADATPTDRMRVIDSDTRRYLLTNLDYPTDSPFRSRMQSTSSQYDPASKTHPYLNSQPASANPTLSTPGVRAGKFIAVSAAIKDEVAQSEVTLRVATRGGSHARLNEATGEVEAVPILVEVEPKSMLEAVVEERPNATVIKLRFLT